MLSSTTTLAVAGAAWILVSPLPVALSNPMSKPYIPFRTSPFAHSHLHHSLTWDDPVAAITTTNSLSSYNADASIPDPHCPLQFSLGVSHRHHHQAPGKLGIVQPPVIFPILPALGPGRQVLYTTQYEHLDLLTPVRSMTGNKNSVIKEGLIQHLEYPLLFESSSFFGTSPILRDVNGDGILDVILADYDGGIYAMGLQASKDGGKRYFHKTQIPRLHVRRQWMESLVNETLGIQPTTTTTNDEKEEASISMADDIPMDHYDRRQARRAHDPYHSFFEYSYGASHEHESILRGVSANVLGLAQDHVMGLEERRKRRIQHIVEEVTTTTDSEPGAHFVDEEQASGDGLLVGETNNGGQGEIDELTDETKEDHRRLQEVMTVDHSHRRLEQVVEKVGKEQEQDAAANGDDPSEAEPVPEPVDAVNAADEEAAEAIKDASGEGGNEVKRDPNADVDGTMPIDDDGVPYSGDDVYTENTGDDILGADPLGQREGDASDASIYGDDDVTKQNEEYPKYDDYYGRYSNREHDDYYDEKHYVRLPPHILCTPVAAELPKLYGKDGEVETFLFVAVSYYFDEDEYEGFVSYKRFRDRDRGDATEVQRGMYVANALVVYQFGTSPRWGRQLHLDMSTDHSAPINTTLVATIPLQQDNTKMGAFALSSPTIADLDGDGTLEVIIGTSMGVLYVFDARNLLAKDGWPVQFQRGIESRVLVEDVRGDTNLELFVADVGGTVACFTHKGEKLWHRNLVDDVTNGDQKAEILAVSPMVLGDVDGDGMLDLVQLLRIRMSHGVGMLHLFAMSADTGKYLKGFPKRIDKSEDQPKSDSEEFVVQKLPPPLLVDLHVDQSWLESYIHRGGNTFTKPTPSHPRDKPPHGGPNIGLHIVFPVEKGVVIMEGASGCAQTISIGDEVLAMVQADDVHGTGSLDLLITTASGNVVTLESPAPFHPLNVWNNGEIRGRTNNFAHGYSASQGIFVHNVSREYRDIFGVYIPVTFEIFDNRPNINNEPDKRVYFVEIRVGTSLPIFRKTYNTTGVFTPRVYIPYGPGYYQITTMLKTTHGIIYEDSFHLGYNVNYMKGFGLMLWLPLLLSFVCIFLCGTRKTHWDDENYDGDERNGRQGILGGPLPE